MRLNDVVQLIRGKRGTTVRLQVLRESELGLDTLKFSIVRDKIVLKEGEAQSHIFEPEKASSELPSLKHRIGVIKLPSFYVDFNDRRKNPNNYKSSSRDVKKHLEQFVDSKVDGLILDLRSNGGGGLDEAITMAGCSSVEILWWSSGNPADVASPFTAAGRKRFSKTPSF